MQKLTKASGGIVSDEATFAILEKGNQAYKEAKFDEAIGFYQQFLDKNPNLYQVQLSIADSWREKGEFDKAIEIYNKVIEQSKADAVLGKEMAAKSQAGIGNCYLKQNKLAEAQDFFKQSIENSPTTRSWLITSARFFSPTKAWMKPSSTSIWPSRSGRSGPTLTSSWDTFISTRQIMPKLSRISTDS